MKKTIWKQRIQIGGSTEERWTEHITKLYGDREKEPDYKGSTNNENNEIKPITEEKINKGTKKLKNRQVPRPDQIHKLKTKEIYKVCR